MVVKRAMEPGIEIIDPTVSEKNPAELIRKFSFKGFNAKNQFEKQQQDSQLSASGIPRRFWIRTGETHTLTFLDGNWDGTWFDTLTLWEHNPRVSGRYDLYYVCPNRPVKDEDKEDCPLCDDGDRPYLVTFFTVIDHTGFEYRGRKYENVLRVYGAKRRGVSQLVFQSDEHKGLAGARFRVTRLDGQASTGETFSFEKKFPVEALQKKYKCNPFDYYAVTNFNSRAELIEMGFGSKAVGEETFDEGDEIDIDEQV